ncbi:hypothetical protein [Herbaspirillum camelliae]|uniref:hypothetical protein n=1 Tax=Herbaspirillum camelliae TaxID=1892903 RepID=UPI00117B3B20|nr:hypothetical protein [Herbaspirillum camelliae]
MNRIEKVLKGTAQYYRSPIWCLYSPKKWTRLEFELAIRELDPLFRHALRPRQGKYRLTSPGAERAEKKIARSERRRDRRRGKRPPPPQDMFSVQEPEPEEAPPSEPPPPKMRFYFSVILTRALEALSDPKLGMSALSTIFLMLIELHKLKNRSFYYVMCLGWIEAEKLRHQHPLLKHLPLDLFHRALNPAIKLLTSKSQEMIRTGRDMSSGEPIDGSDVFWFFSSEKSWKDRAREFDLIR